MVDESQEIVGSRQFERFFLDIVLLLELVAHSDQIVAANIITEHRSSHL